VLLFLRGTTPHKNSIREVEQKNFFYIAQMFQNRSFLALGVILKDFLTLPYFAFARIAPLDGFFCFTLSYTFFCAISASTNLNEVR
jgi:hypothetical protein